ncbi:hypothetical protein DFJ58DRAFT_705127 [Suillus subalutaceus]|uniref:uncharacterized protein n=1 Tax=Suillus subalutaceus TaxID=48586 RepID=UPI001B85F546|nr:uncharacterized protein DFJ58DRAFT_705127 [Suillus subalutaceus]KAG1848064.1 hypothetical protein DFJ58DRAFT_705127 [Suillus subalutaceus]
MHFWIPEVVQLIFEYVYDPGRAQEDNEGRVTVAGLARTCQAFRDPALDVLWAQLHSLDALVICSGGRRVNDNSQVVWERPLYDADWRILASYVKRVHKLTVSPQLDTWDISAMHILNCFPLPGALLPSLTELNWLSDREDIFPFLHCFCGPTLQTLRLSPVAWSIRKCVAVASLAPSCPSLENLMCLGADDSSMQAISEAVVGWKKLKTLEAGPVNERALTHAASLQTLQSLRFSASSELTPHVLEFCSPHAILEIAAPTPLSLQALIQNVHFSIQYLFFHCSLYDDVFPHLFFTHLKICVVHPEKLTRLSLVIESVSTEDTSNESIVLTSLMLHPLLSFKGLSHLDLGRLCTAHMDDIFLSKLALACPSLKELHLGDQGAWLTAPLLTFDGVISLLKHCRQLSSLGVFFNATLESDAVHAAPVDAISPKIKYFLVGVSPIGEPVKVAAVLSFLFPSATCISHCIPYEWPEQPQGKLEKWESVSKMFGTFVSARKQSWEQGWAEGKASVEKITMA